MFDPAVMGTLLIGLDAIRADERPEPRRRSVTTPRRGHGGVRTALAQALRRAAAVVDRPPVGERAS